MQNLTLAKVEDWSKMSTRQRIGYRLVRLLGRLQQIVYHRIICCPVWRSADGTCTPLTALTDSHLNNIVRMLQRNGGQIATLEVMLSEQLRRKVVR